MKMLGFITYYRVILIFMVLVMVIPLKAQKEEKASARISLSYINMNNSGPRLQALLRTKEGRSYIPVTDEKVTFFMLRDSGRYELGEAISQNDGIATLVLPETLRKVIDTSYLNTYEAELINSEKFDDAETSLEIKPSKMTFELDEEDSIRTVKLKIEGLNEEGKWVPLPDLEPTIGVKRMFGFLRLSEEYESTDDEGIMELEFPNDLPGNASGELIIMAKLEDHDEFGTLILQENSKWGIVSNHSDVNNERELWSTGSNAPRYLVYTVSFLLILIWGTIIYLIYNLIKIHILGKQALG